MMPVPKYDDLMNPLLRLAGDRKEKVFRETVEALAEEFGAKVACGFSIGLRTSIYYLGSQIQVLIEVWEGKTY